MDEAIRLQRYLSQCGVAARRKAEELIESGSVTVNGEVVTELGTKVVPGKDQVAVDGEAVYPEEPFYVLLNKPKGCLTAVSDPEDRPTVMEYLPNVPAHVAPVGRLDFYSEGVLLLTNDGELSARLQSPEYHVEKTYHVKIRERLKPRDIEALRQGVRLDDGVVTRPAQVDLLTGTKSKHEWLVITLTEGKSRQIHRMLGALGYQVIKLQRVAYAGITFHGLRVGDARELTQVEINTLREMVGLSKDTVARGKWKSLREDTDLGRRARARARARAGAPPYGTGGYHEERGTGRPVRAEGEGGQGARSRGPARPRAGAGGARAGGAGRPARAGGFGGARAGGPGRPARAGGFGGARTGGAGRPARGEGAGEGPRGRGPGRPARPEGFGSESRPRGGGRGGREEGFGGPRGGSRGGREEGFGGPRGGGRGGREEGFGGPRGGGRGGREEGFGGPRGGGRGGGRGGRDEGFGGSRGAGRGGREEGFGGPRGGGRGARDEGFGGPRPRGPGRPPRDGGGEGPRARGPGRPRPEGGGPSRPGGRRPGGGGGFQSGERRGGGGRPGGSGKPRKPRDS